MIFFGCEWNNENKIFRMKDWDTTVNDSGKWIIVKTAIKHASML